MTDVLVKPAFVSALPDTGDTTRLGPNAWNAARLFSAGALGDLLYRDTGSATGASWLTASAGVLVWTGAGVAPTVTTAPTLAGTNFTGIPEAAITDGALLARLAANEVVAGAWAFSQQVNGADAGFGFTSQTTTRIYLSGSTLLFKRTGTDVLGLDNTGIYLGSGGTVQWGNAAAAAAGVTDLILARGDAGVATLRGTSASVGAALNFLEQADAAAPASNQAVVYAKDNGAGKTLLVVRFPTGAVQTIATEP